MHYTVFTVRRDKEEVGHQSVEFFLGFFLFLVRQPEVRHQSVTLESPYRDLGKTPYGVCFFFYFSEARKKKPNPWGFWKDHALDLVFAA